MAKGYHYFYYLITFNTDKKLIKNKSSLTY